VPLVLMVIPPATLALPYLQMLILLSCQLLLLMVRVSTLLLVLLLLDWGWLRLSQERGLQQLGAPLLCLAALQVAIPAELVSAETASCYGSCFCSSWGFRCHCLLAQVAAPARYAPMRIPRCSQPLQQDKKNQAFDKISFMAWIAW
jgi:hypothetical protein